MNLESLGTMLFILLASCLAELIFPSWMFFARTGHWGQAVCPPLRPEAASFLSLPAIDGLSPGAHFGFMPARQVCIFPEIPRLGMPDKFLACQEPRAARRSPTSDLVMETPGRGYLSPDPSSPMPPHDVRQLPCQVR